MSHKYDSFLEQEAPQEEVQGLGDKFQITRIDQST